MLRNLVVAITGASGAIYGVRLLDVLLAAGRSVHLVISPAGAEVLRLELGLKVDCERFRLEDLLPPEAALATDSPLRRWLARSNQSASGRRQPAEQTAAVPQQPKRRGTVYYHRYQDFFAPIASGSHLTGGMAVCPCSMDTLAAIASGLSANLIQRAADIHLKERRPLILVPRETPLSAIQLDNMRRAAEAGAVLLPAMPGFYHDPNEIGDLVDFVVGRVCDQLSVEHQLFRRWGQK
jgi:4-hydroxy-3-polyprenylbenzoate decarboxylase